MRTRPRTRLLLPVLMVLGGCKVEGPGAVPEPQPESLPGAALGLACVANPPSQANAVRLLEQASFGPTPALVADVQCKGVGGWIDEQLALPPTAWAAGSTGDAQLQFFANALTAPDQLRQRVALALSEILVVSGFKLKADNAVISHLNALINNAWGSNFNGTPLVFEDLLYAVTLDPGMGDYLDMVNNNKETANSVPNENYARELLQLFSVGLHVLNDDGTPGTRPLPLTYCLDAPAGDTYCQDEVEALAHVLTGWTYGPNTGNWKNPANYTVPLVSVASHHDTAPLPGGKLLGEPFAPTANADTDLKNALHVLATTSVAARSLPPFICKQLIQHLVTSNPSAAYIGNCVARFKDDKLGKAGGVRGNLAAVVRTILTDPEARNPALNAPVAFGHLKEPLLYMSNLLRLFSYTRTKPGLALGGGLTNYGTKMGQRVFYPTTVFNYFPPDFPLPNQAPGGTLLGPEYAIENSSTLFARANFANSLLLAPGGLVGNSSTTMPGPFATVDDAVTWLDTYMLHGAMTGALRNSVRSTLGVTLPIPDATFRHAVYVVATSAEYKVER